MERICDICGYVERLHLPEEPEGHKFVPSGLLIGAGEAQEKMINLRVSTRDRQVQKIHELHQVPHTFSEIALILGVSPYFVQQILDKVGVDDEEEPEPTHDPTDNCTFRSALDAEAVLDALNVMVDTYGSASIADLYDLVGITGNFTDNKWGWTNVQGATIDRVEGGYALNMPQHEPLPLSKTPVSKDPEILDPNLEREIAAVLNKYSVENASNTPDFILAEYLTDCLKAFNSATRRTKEWSEN